MPRDVTLPAWVTRTLSAGVCASRRCGAWGSPAPAGGRPRYQWGDVGYGPGMTSDIILVLRSDHRELLTLAEQCARPSRGFQDPEDELRRRLAAHAAAREAAVPSPPDGVGPDPQLHEAGDSVPAGITDLWREGVVVQAVRLVAFEREHLLPALDRLLIADRRRMGKVFRIHRERALRHSSPRVRRQRSQSELYELARRAGIEQRSRMTQAQLDEAVSAWERASSPKVRTTD